MQPRDKAIETGIILLFVDTNNKFDVFWKKAPDQTAATKLWKGLVNR